MPRRFFSGVCCFSDDAGKLWVRCRLIATGNLRSGPGAIAIPLTLIDVDVFDVLARGTFLGATALRKDLGVNTRASIDAANRKVLAQRETVETFPHQDALEI